MVRIEFGANERYQERHFEKYSKMQAEENMITNHANQCDKLKNQTENKTVGRMKRTDKPFKTMK